MLVSVDAPIVAQNPDCQAHLVGLCAYFSPRVDGATALRGTKLVLLREAAKKIGTVQELATETTTIRLQGSCAPPIRANKEQTNFLKSTHFRSFTLAPRQQSAIRRPS